MPRPVHRQELYTATSIVEASVGIKPCIGCCLEFGHELWCPTKLHATREERRMWSFLRGWIASAHSSQI